MSRDILLSSNQADRAGNSLPDGSASGVRNKPCSTRTLVSFVWFLFIIGSACGNGYVEPPHPTCIVLQRLGKNQTVSHLNGALFAKLSSDSPAGRLPRFFNQTIFSADLTTAAGPTCEDIRLGDLIINIPAEFHPPLRAQEEIHLYLDVLDGDHELERLENLGNGYHSKMPISLKPGESHKLVIVVNSTYFVPVTMGAVTLEKVYWTARDRYGGIAYESTNTYGNPVTGQPIIFDRTMKDVCSAVEDKIAAIGMPLKDWQCLGERRDFVIIAPRDLKDCQMWITDYGFISITPDQITSPTEFRIVTEGGMDFRRCTHT